MAPQGEDFREGLTAVVTVRIPNPQFESQTKIKLVNAEVDGAMNSVVGEMLAKYFEENPTTAKNICQKGLRSAEAREAARKARDMIRSQNKVSGGGLPEKLRDCRNHALDVSEIYLVEGDSAGGSADTGRDSANQAILPLRGKILNVEKAQAVKVLANKEVAAIFRALGIPPLAEEVDINKRRYGKVILMTDADVDGSHIRTLLLTFFFRHMRELVRTGCVYIAQPPLYRVVPKGKKNAKPRYVQTHEEMMGELLNLGLDGTTLVLKPRVNILSKRDGSELNLDPVGEQREMSGDMLRKLSDILSRLDESLEALERRGISLRRLAMDHATADGMLPRFRVLHSGEEHWLASKVDVDAFLAERQQTTGKELKTADDSLGGTSDALPPAAGEQAPVEGNGGTTITVTDLHEVRTINDTLRQMQEFGLTLNDLLPPPPRNAEVVYPYEIVGPDTPRRMQTLRELVPKLRDIGDKGFNRTRFKGLGEMNPEELFETAMDPETRILKRVTLEDAAGAEEIFRVLMGEHVEPRREFIEKHALEVKDLDV